MVLDTHAQALRAFASQPACLDTVIAAMERSGPDLPSEHSDLAAAYYVRAQRDDEPLDLLLALDAARLATAGSPSPPEARFNHALILEALGLSNDAIASWDQLQASEGRSSWTDEARDHLDQLQSDRDHDAATQWQLQRSRLAAVLRQNDPATVAQLIREFPGSAQTYFEEEVLGRWGEQPSNENLTAAKTLATALSNRLGGDPCDVDIVKAIEAAEGDSGKVVALASGHLSFSKARRAEKSFRWADADRLYVAAGQSLDRGGSPLRLHAELGHAVALALNTDGYGRALPLLESIEKAATTMRCSHLLARIEATRAYFLTYSSAPVEALSASDRALARYSLLGDSEGVAYVQNRRIGYLGILGQQDLAWRAAFARIQTTAQIVELKEQHFLLAETARAVQALDHPEAALLYQNDAVRAIRRARAATPGRELDRLKAVHQNLSIALRGRASIRNQLGDPSAAMDDLSEASRLKEMKGDANNLRALDARLQQVHGQILLRARVPEAVIAFTRALAAAGNDELPTFRASVLAQRAEAHRRLGHINLARQDLTRAADELRAEEAATLAPRRRGESESLWTSYFTRSRATYQLLIRHTVDEERPLEAFQYAERARAFEPLNLILQLPDLPSSFRDLTPNGDSMSVSAIRRHLPPGTFLIEYSIHEDRTYAWVLSRDSLEQMTLPADTESVARWTETLQRAARHQNERLLESSLDEPYDSLIATPLAAIESMPGGRDPARRLVIIPDGAMHGLPFAALKNRMTGHHLLEDATVEIAGSATLYVFSLLRNAQLSSGQPPSALLIGAPRVSPQLSLVYGLGPLRGARLEVDKLRSIYSPHADVRTDAIATVPDFLEQVPRHTVVHFAGHAVANPKEPARSTLFLAPSPGQTGALEAQELMKRLQPGRTRLVVLAACSSAGGVPVGPEGLAPLVRPFLTSGVPAVIGSLWDVNDATAEPLLVSFHRNYRQSGDAAVALQSAQRELLGKNKKAGRKPALAWAPFQVIGH